MDSLNIGIGTGMLLASFLVPGILLWLIFRDRCSPWLSSTFAALYVTASRLITGGWSVRLGGETSGTWLTETSLALVSWSIAAIITQLSYKLCCRLFKTLGFSR